MTTWVLLRGLIRESRHWGEFASQFKNAINTQHMVALDFPGNGKLHAQPSADSVAEMVNSCRSQLGQLGYAPPYNILALSLGAMAAVAWSELYPADLEKMVLINTSLSPYSPFYHRLRPANYPALIRIFLYGSVAQKESLILCLTSTMSQTRKQQEILEQWIAYAREYPITRANILRQLKAAFCYRAVQTAPHVPVLLLAGEQDKLVNVKCSLKLAQRWHCAISLHPTAGHDLPLDDGEWVTQQIQKWLLDMLLAPKAFPCNKYTITN